MKEKNSLTLTLANVWKFPVRSPHFGLLSMASYIKKKKPRIKINVIEGENPTNDIIASKPDIIGFSSDTLMFNATVAKAREIKERTDSPLVIGGVHITAMPESLNPLFKFGVVGEGELTLLEILNIYQRYKRFPKKELIKIQGLVYFDRDKIIQTEKREFINNIDDLPYPARNLVPMNEYYLKDQMNLFGVKRMATIMTSRGCPYQCVFCGSPVQWGRVRFHSPEYVVSEIKLLLKEYNIDGIMFWDDLFIAPEKRVEKLAELIKKDGLDKKLTFFGYARANLINEKTCRILASMNVKRLIFGLESGSEKILNYLKQNSVSIADNKRAITLCRKFGITSSSGYITGTPGETIKDLRKTY